MTEAVADRYPFILSFQNMIYEHINLSGYSSKEKHMHMVDLSIIQVHQAFVIFPSEEDTGKPVCVVLSFQIICSAKEVHLEALGHT